MLQLESNHLNFFFFFKKGRSIATVECAIDFYDSFPLLFLFSFIQKLFKIFCTKTREYFLKNHSFNDNKSGNGCKINTFISAYLFVKKK